METDTIFGSKHKGISYETTGKDTILEVMQLLQSVDINSPDAQLNATSITDGNGGRIFL